MFCILHFPELIAPNLPRFPESASLQGTHDLNPLQRMRDAGGPGICWRADRGAQAAPDDRDSPSYRPIRHASHQPAELAADPARNADADVSHGARREVSAGL